MIVNCSGGVRFSLFSLLDSPAEKYLPRSCSFFLAAELVLIVLATVYKIYFLCMVLKIKIWHTNLNTIISSGILAMIGRNVGRIMIIKEELSLFPHGFCTPWNFWGGLVMCFAYILYLHTLPLVLVERAFAYLFLQNYESRRRLWVPLLTLTLISVLSAFLAVRIYTLQLVNPYGAVYGAIMISISMAGHSLLWWRNQKTLLAYGSPSSRPASYTLSKRYQIVENLRTFRLGRNMLVTLVFEAAIALGIRLFMAAFPWKILLYIESCFSILFQFMVITTCILSCEKWREKVFPSFGRPLPKRRIHVGTAEQDIYFKQLEAAWS